MMRAPPLRTAVAMADTPQVVLQKMQALDKDLVTHEPGMRKAWESVRKELRTAIDDESEDEIKLALPTLDPAIEKIDQGLDACDRLHVMTTELMKSATFVAQHRDDVKKIVSHVAATKKQLSDAASDARKLRDEAQKALGVAQKGARATEAELGGLKNRATKLDEDVAACKAQFPKLEKAAREATGKDDDKSAEKARLAILDLMVQPKRRATELRPLLKAFQDAHPDLEREQKAELTWVADSLRETDETLDAGMKLFNTLIKLKQQAVADKAQRPAAPVEVPKAELVRVAPIVGIDPKDAKGIVALGKVLNTTAHEKWAEGLSRLVVQLKLKGPNGTNGKAMVAAIDKLPFFKKMAAAAH